MVNKAELLKAKVLEHDYKIRALDCIFDQLRNVMNEVLESPLVTRSFNAPPNDASNGKALILGADTSSRSDSDIVLGGESSPAMRQLLGMLGIISNYESSQDRLNRLLNASVIDQEHKLDQRCSEAETWLVSTIQAATESVSDAQQLLVDALLADTAHAGSDLQSRKEQLQTKVEMTGSGLAGLNLDRLRDETDKRKAFVDRWNAE